MSDDVAMKIFTLSILMGVMALIGGYGLGEVADQLITWFDMYADDTKHAEGTQKTDSDKIDPDGTSAQYDIIYHYVTLAFGYVVFTTISLGGYIFGFNYINFSDPVECDFDAVDASVKAEIGGLFAGMTSVESCYEILPRAMALLDVNKNGRIDRCEDATMLNYFGNTVEYSLKYSHVVPLALAK